MVCIYCGGKTAVLNSRSSTKTPKTWRRRQCLGCSNTVTTREQVDLSDSLRVKDNSGRLEPFQRDKFFLSLYSSLSHRKTALKDAAALTDTVIEKVVSTHSNGVIELRSLASAAVEVLQRFDKPAAVYYKAHYL